MIKRVIQEIYEKFRNRFNMKGKRGKGKRNSKEC